MVVAVFRHTHPDHLLPGPVWGFEGDFATLSFIALPMINEVDVRDEKRENEGKGAKGKDSKGRTTSKGTASEGTARKYVYKKKKLRVTESEFGYRIRGRISKARSKGISGAIRIIVNKAHYPTYCSPSCSPYRISGKISHTIISQ